MSPFVYIAVKNSTYKRTDFKEDFLNGDYIAYNGGKVAQKFFERFVSLDGYETISFKYRDKENAITLKSATHTTFVLDVKYGSESYIRHKENIWGYTNKPNKNDMNNYFGSYLITVIDNENDIYSDNCCAVCFCEEQNIIRYVFLYNVKRQEVNVYSFSSVTMNSSCLNCQPECDVEKSLGCNGKILMRRPENSGLKDKFLASMEN